MNYLSAMVSSGHMDIRLYISSLLALHDCVIVPGFGGFIGNYTPARIDQENHAFLPPAKKLLFNVNLRQNDGLLAGTVASGMGITFDAATRLIDTFVADCRQTIREGKSFVIPGVGRIFSGREGNLQFEQERSANLLPDAFGLTSFISPPIVRNGLSAGNPAAGQSPVGKGSGKSIRLPGLVKWAAILAVPVGAALFFGINQYRTGAFEPMNNAGVFSSVFSRFSSASLVERKQAPDAPPRQQFQFEQTPSAFGTSLPEEVDDVMQALPEPAPVNEATSDLDVMPAVTISASPQGEKTVPADPSGRAEPKYIVIVGAFRAKHNAEKLVSDLKRDGMDAVLFDRSETGLFRVSIGEFEQREEASQLLDAARSGDLPGAWLLEK